MTTDYAKKARLAKRLIEKFGGNATLETKTNTGTDARPVFTKSTVTVKIVDLDVMEGSVGKSGVAVRTRTLYMTSDTEPEEKDRIQIGTEWHVIDAVYPLKPNPQSVVVLYEVKLRA